MDAATLRACLRCRSHVPAFDLAFLIATLSEKGIALLRQEIASWLDHGRQSGRFRPETRSSQFSRCACMRFNPEASVQLANVAAGIVVGKVGTVPVEKHELLARCP